MSHFCINLVVETYKERVIIFKQGQNKGVLCQTKYLYWMLVSVFVWHHKIDANSKRYTGSRLLRVRLVRALGYVYKVLLQWVPLISCLVLTGPSVYHTNKVCMNDREFSKWHAEPLQLTFWTHDHSLPDLVWQEYLKNSCGNWNYEYRTEKQCIVTSVILLPFHL